MTYSLDLRDRALKYIENDGTWKSASQTFGITVRTLAHWLSRKRQNNLSPKARQTGSYKIDEVRLKDFLAKNPDAYLKEIAEEFKTTIPAIFYACKRSKITLKKRGQFVGELNKIPDLLYGDLWIPFYSISS